MTAECDQIACLERQIRAAAKTLVAEARDAGIRAGEGLASGLRTRLATVEQAIEKLTRSMAAASDGQPAQESES